MPLTNIQALSKISFLNYTEKENQYCITNKKLKEINNNLKLNDLYGELIEIWNYPPIKFDYNSSIWKENFIHNSKNKIIDPISLYISLKSSQDPRVEEEIHNLRKLIIKYMEENDSQL